MARFTEFNEDADNYGMPTAFNADDGLPVSWGWLDYGIEMESDQYEARLTFTYSDYPVELEVTGIPARLCIMGGPEFSVGAALAALADIKAAVERHGGDLRAAIDGLEASGELPDVHVRLTV